MALDRVHVRGLERHGKRIGRAIDEREYQDAAESVWTNALDPLVDDGGRVVLEPLAEQSLRAMSIEDAALQSPPFETSHGLDSGTINPTSYKNGLVLDVAQAAMAAVPSDLDVHRDRTLVTTVHTPDPAAVHEHTEPLDDGHTTSRLLRAPQVSRFEESVVHELALYLAESCHALDHFDAVEDLLVLDGPIYPKGMLNWADRAPELEQLLYDEPTPRDVVQNYVELVEQSVEREIPLLGFVKNPSTKAITRTLRERDWDARWVGDAAFFTRLLERRELVETVDESGQQVRERRRDESAITYTSWFRSRGGADRLLAAGAGTLDVDVTLDPEAYEVTFFALYDPRDDLLYRVEAPYEVTRAPERRERLTQFVLREVATEQGPPEAVAKADELARIGRQHTADLREALGEAFGADQHRTYDDERWGHEERM